MRKSLRFKMILIFSSIVLLSCLIISISSYISSINLVKDSLSEMAGRIAEQSLEIIDVDKYEKEITLEGEETPYYKGLRAELNELRENTGLTYLYTMSRKKTGEEYKYYYMVDGMPFGDEDASQLGDEEDVESYPNIVKAFETGKTQIEMSNDEYGALVSTYVPLKSSSGEIIGIVGADLDATQVYKSMAANGNKLIVSTIIILLLSIIVVYLFSYYLSKPLKDLTNQVTKVSNGDLSIQLVTKRTDEIGTLTKSFQQMTNELKKIIHEIHNNANELVVASNQLLTGTNEVKEGNKQISLTMQELSEGADTQSESATKVSEAMETFTNELHQADSKGTELNQSSQSVIQLTNIGFSMMGESEKQMEAIHQEVAQSIEKVKGLDARSKEISQLVQVIQQIADQTNLLALNAAIEAARAGEHGKGFAVVAEEVRKLAEQVSGSIGSIIEIVEGVQKESTETVSSLEQGYLQVNEGTKKISTTRETFKDIKDSVVSMQSQIQSITENLNIISKQSEEINHALENVAATAQQSSAGIEQTSASIQQTTSTMDEIVAHSKSLSDLAEKLRLSVDHFKLDNSNS